MSKEYTVIFSLSTVQYESKTVVFSKNVLCRSYLVSLEYVDYQTKVECASCCKRWYHSWMVKYIRHFTLVRTGNHYGTFEESVDIIKTKISNPFNQITLILHEISLKDLPVHLLASANYELFKLKCNQSEFVDIMKNTSRLRIKQLLIIHSSDQISDSVLQESFAKVVDCETLHPPTAFIPPLLSVRSLTMQSINLQTDALINMVHSLQHLFLCYCRFSDASLLGCIPSLRLYYCSEISDISCLNDNQTIIIQYCNAIHDYSQSFMNTRKINVLLSDHRETSHFNLLRWQKVEHLSLQCSSRSKIHFTNAHNQLPKTVKRCVLGGKFVTAVDFTVTAEHRLQDIELSANEDITSLIGYGLEQVAIIECDNLRSLKSLQGLGQGKNQKFTICSCDFITDFSPIGHLPQVEINACYEFTNPLQVRFVRELIIRSSRFLSFQGDQTVVPNPYASIQSLALIDSSACLNSFNGLETIPILILNNAFLKVMIDFLKTGKQLENEKIVVEKFSRHEHPEEIFKIHDEYLQYQSYYSPKRLGNTWVWIRKSG